MYTKLHRGLIRSLQSLGKREQLGRYISKGGRYEDAVQYDKYKVEFFNDDDDIRFILWNPTRPCIVAVIDKHDKSAVIDDVEYSPSCAVDGRMKRGEGTRDMLQFMFVFLKKHGATSVQLSDKSSVVCNGVKVRLGLMYFFKYGETWYEHHFGFKPTEKYRHRYERIKQKRQAVIGDLSNVPCDAFTDEFIDDLVEKLGFGFFYNISWEKTLSSI